MKNLCLAVAMAATMCGTAAAQTVTCVERNVTGELYGRVQVKRDGDVRTFTQWNISDGREKEPSSYEIRQSDILVFEHSEFFESDDNYDWEQINLNKGGTPWFLVVDYGLPMIITGGYAKGLEDPLVHFNGDDCTISD